MSRAPVRVAITGAAGQIGYQLSFRIASGQMLGPDQPVILQLLEIAPALDGIVHDLTESSLAGLTDDGVPQQREKSIRRIAEMRVSGQDQTLAIDFQSSNQLKSEFEARFSKLFGYAVPADRHIEIVSVIIQSFHVLFEVILL